MGQSEGAGEEDQTEEPKQAGPDVQLSQEVLSSALPVRSSAGTTVSFLPRPTLLGIFTDVKVVCTQHIVVKKTDFVLFVFN